MLERTVRAAERKMAKVDAAIVAETRRVLGGEVEEEGPPVRDEIAMAKARGALRRAGRLRLVDTHDDNDD